MRFGRHLMIDQIAFILNDQTGIGRENRVSQRAKAGYISISHTLVPLLHFVNGEKPKSEQATAPTPFAQMVHLARRDHGTLSVYRCVKHDDKMKRNDVPSRGCCPGEVPKRRQPMTKRIVTSGADTPRNIRTSKPPFFPWTYQ